MSKGALPHPHTKMWQPCATRIPLSALQDHRRLASLNRTTSNAISLEALHSLGKSLLGLQLESSRQQQLKWGPTSRQAPLVWKSSTEQRQQEDVPTKASGDCDNKAPVSLGALHNGSSVSHQKVGGVYEAAPPQPGWKEELFGEGPLANEEETAHMEAPPSALPPYTLPTLPANERIALWSLRAGAPC